MRSLSGWFLVTSLFVAGLARAQSTSSMADQILPLLNEQLLAANAHDADRFLATYVHGPNLVFIANGQIIHGWDALHDQQLKWWKNGKSDVVYAQESQPEVAVLDPETVLVTQQITAHRTGPDGKPTDSTAAITTIWRRLPIGWRVTYGHESWVR
jgi:ketosteroid isomerase-like protein